MADLPPFWTQCDILIISGRGLYVSLKRKGFLKHITDGAVDHRAVKTQGFRTFKSQNAKLQITLTTFLINALQFGTGS